MTNKIPLVAGLAAIATLALSSFPANAQMWREAETYYPPYAYSPAYQYGLAPYACCALATIEPAYGRPLSYARPRYRYVDYRNSHRWGFWGERGAYYVYR